jgi:ribosomal protein L11 methyltransferase
VRARVARGPIPPGEILKELGGAPGATRRSVRSAIRDLVACGEIAYAVAHGRTVLEPSFHRAVSVSPRITLAPPDAGGAPQQDGVVVRIACGAAFGAGQHPTTRLALRGIDAVLQPDMVRPGGGVLDVGTGTGVLVIAAAALGLSGGIGIDLDPCAVAEARHNVRLNGMQERIRISDQPLETLGGSFTLVTANLRAPSLVRLGGRLRARVALPGALVVSGMRPDERAAVVAALAGGCLHVTWAEEEGGWGAVAFTRRE